MNVWVQILMFPSKSDGMFVPESLIFRSDSNGEDLEGYAGAGLYDSITMDTTELKKVDYNGDRYDFTLRQYVLEPKPLSPAAGVPWFAARFCSNEFSPSRKACCMHTNAVQL